MNNGMEYDMEYDPKLVMNGMEYDAKLVDGMIENV